MMNRDKTPTVTSWDYIRDNFQPDDRLAVVIKNKSGIRQRISTAERVASFRFQAWLRFENAQGGDVYVSMNPLKPAAVGRTKSDIVVVRHLYLDLDINGPSALEAICNDSRIPKPSYVLNTSAGKYQVIWKVTSRDTEKAEQLLRAMAVEYGADRAATDATRVLRIPGFYNRKYDPSYQVMAQKLSSLTYTLSDFQISLQAEQHPVKRPQPVHRISGTASQSERDWAETLQRLDRGENPGVVQAWLEQKRQDKPNPAYYAALTVRKALAEQRSRHSTAIDIEHGL